ncbi:MAG: hypothetical protein ACRDRE_23395, partial [Pseudonocardiaceae bacterium]
MNITVFDVEGLNIVGLAGVNTAVSECGPGRRNTKKPTATLPLTCTGEPILVIPSWNWTVPDEFKGATFAMGSAIPFNPKGSRIWTTESVVVVAAAPGEGDGLGLGDGLELGLGNGLGLGDGLELGLGNGLGLGDGLELGLGNGLGLGDGLELGLG